MTQSNHQNQIIPEQVEAQALAWLSRQMSGEMKDSERLELLDWLDASPINQTAFDQLQSELGLIDQALFAKPPVIPERVRADKVTSIESRLTEIPKPSRQWQSAFLATAAALALIMVNFALTPQLHQQIGADYVASKGTQTEQHLSDGSILQLNSGTAVNLNYSDEVRSIALRAGEAAFTVAKDAQRPFTVSANGWNVTALGTEFIVKENSDGISVTVLESSVSVYPSGQSVDQGQVVKAGEQLVVSSQSSQLRIPPPNASSWLQGELIFNQTPFSQVVKEVNRHRQGRIFLTNPDLAERKLTLVVRLNEIDQLLPVLANELQIKYTKLSDSLVFLY